MAVNGIITAGRISFIDMRDLLIFQKKQEPVSISRVLFSTCVGRSTYKTSYRSVELGLVLVYKSPYCTAFLIRAAELFTPNFCIR